MVTLARNRIDPRIKLYVGDDVVPDKYELEMKYTVPLWRRCLMLVWEIIEDKEIYDPYPLNSRWRMRPLQYTIMVMTATRLKANQIRQNSI